MNFSLTDMQIWKYEVNKEINKQCCLNTLLQLWCASHDTILLQIPLVWCLMLWYSDISKSGLSVQIHLEPPQKVWGRHQSTYLSKSWILFHHQLTFLMPKAFCLIACDWLVRRADCFGLIFSQISSLQMAYDNLCSSTGSTAVPHFLLKYTDESVHVASLKDFNSFFTDLKKVISTVKLLVGI